jgi:hypothetical protein
MTVDTPDWVGMTVLHHGKLTLFSNVSQVVAANATYSTGFFTLSKPGYWLFSNAVMAAAASNPFVLFTVTWRDSVTGNFLDEQEWVGPAGTSSAIRTNGRGPTTGDQVRIQVTNLDAVQSVTIKLIFLETTHAIARHDWRSNIDSSWSSISVNTQPAPCSVFSGTMFQGSPSIPANTTESYLMGLYCGTVYLAEQDAGATNLTISVGPFQALDSASGTPRLFNQLGSATGIRAVFALPRQPCIVVVQNFNAAAVVCNLNIGIQENAS